MTLDFSTKAWQENLPATGPHQAEISEIRFNPKEDITWLNITWKLADGGAVEEFLGVDAPPDSPMLAKTANGKRRINGLCEMHDLKPSFKSYDDITAALMGKSATVTIGHKFKGGMDEPIICGVTAPEKKK
jgi:hypothetical protein